MDKIREEPTRFDLRYTSELPDKELKTLFKDAVTWELRSLYGEARNHDHLVEGTKVFEDKAATHKFWAAVYTECAKLLGSTRVLLEHSRS